MAITVYLKNGQHIEVRDAVSVAWTANSAGVETAHKDMLSCADAEGKTVAEFFVADVTGYVTTSTHGAGAGDMLPVSRDQLAG